MIEPFVYERMPPARDPVLLGAPVRVGRVALTVRDLDRVAAFYESAIGLAIVERHGDRLSLGCGSTSLVELRHDPGARLSSAREAGLFHTAFLLPERADLGAWAAMASRKRLPLLGASDHGVSEALYLSDPEGNGIEVYADRPGEDWQRSVGGIAMVSDPLDIEGLLRAGADRDWTGFPTDGVVGHVHLQVGAIPTAEAFYGTLLGLDITCRYPGGSFYGSGGYHHQLATNVWNSRGASERSGPATGLAEVELSIEGLALEAIRSRLARSRPHETGTGSLSLHDPWKTAISLVPRRSEARRDTP